MLDNVLCAAAWCVYNEKRYFAAAAIYQLLWGTCPRGERNTQLFSVVPAHTIPHRGARRGEERQGGERRGEARRRREEVGRRRVIRALGNT